jgi:hypothetical protein
VLSYPSAIPLSTRTLTRLAQLIQAERTQRRTRWRRLDCGQQALLVLAHLRNGDTYARLAAGFGIGTSTAWRYVRQTINLLATLAEDLNTAVGRASELVHAILDGTLIPIDRVADQKPYYSGKHKRHGVNVQILADPAGRLIWASPALPGAVHDITAARTHDLIDALTNSKVSTLADKGYQGAGGTITTPFKRHNRRPRLSRNEKAVNRSHARLRGPGERAIATLKGWKVLTKLRCCPRRATAIVQAILVLHTTEASPPRTMKNAQRCADDTSGAAPGRASRSVTANGSWCRPAELRSFVAGCDRRTGPRCDIQVGPIWSHDTVNAATVMTMTTYSGPATLILADGARVVGMASLGTNQRGDLKGWSGTFRPDEASNDTRAASGELQLELPYEQIGAVAVTGVRKVLATRVLMSLVGRGPAPF